MTSPGPIEEPDGSVLRARCARHPELVAVIACARCGDYVCAACRAGSPDETACDRCAERAARPRPASPGTVASSMALSVLVWSLCPCIALVSRQIEGQSMQSFAGIAPEGGAWLLAILVTSFGTLGIVLPVVEATVTYWLARALGGAGRFSMTLNLTCLVQAGLLAHYVPILLPTSRWSLLPHLAPYVVWAVVMGMHARGDHRLTRARSYFVALAAASLFPLFALALGVAFRSSW